MAAAFVIPLGPPRVQSGQLIEADALREKIADSSKDRERNRIARMVLPFIQGGR